MANERELLFGLLALRDEYVTSSQLVAAFSEWLVERGRPLAEVLAAKAGISPEDVADLQKQVERRVRLNGGDVAKSLHGLPLAEEVRHALDGLGDRQFSVDLAAVPGMARPQRAEQPPSEDSLATVAQGSLEEQLLIGGRYRVFAAPCGGGAGAGLGGAGCAVATGGGVQGDQAGSGDGRGGGGSVRLRGGGDGSAGASGDSAGCTTWGSTRMAVRSMRCGSSGGPASNPN